jgi:hypothetical protein
MRPIRPLILIGAILILIGVVGLAVRGITFHHQQQIAQIGPLTASTDKQDHIFFPPYASTAAIIIGGLLVVIGYRRR